MKITEKGKKFNENTLKERGRYSKTGKKLNTDYFCDHCNIYGHIRANWWHLNGYPKKKNEKGKEEESSKKKAKTEVAAIVSSFTDEDYKLIKELIAKSSTPNNSGNASFSHPIFFYNSWICDSGATQHMSGNIHLFYNLHNPHDTKNVIIPSGEVCKTEKIGDIKISQNIILKDVYFIPSFKINLLSIHKLTKDTNINVIFNQNTCIFHDPLSENLIGQGRQKDGLYLFEAMADSMACGVLNYNTWHSRLGHASHRKLELLSNSYKTISFSEKSDECRICPMAKQYKFPFNKSRHISQKKFDLIHVNIGGNFPNLLMIILIIF